jgi:hypothetical protein
VYELIGDRISDISMLSINALEAACLILDDRFGKDFHKKNPKLAVRFADSIMKNIRMNTIKASIHNDIGENLDAIATVIQKKEFKSKESFYEDYADSFRF